MSVVSAEQRFSLYYAVLFGSIGAMAPFAAVWMDHVGIDAAMIGTIVAAPSVAMLLTTIALGRWADNLRDRRLAILAGNWAILLVQVCLFITTDAWVVMVVWLLSGIAMHAKIPITDAAALSLTRQRDGDYARIRVFGSVGFVAMLTVAGFAYDHWGIDIFVAGLLLANLLRLLAASYLPAMPRREDAEDTRAPGRQTDGSLYHSGILLTLFGGALINASHAMVYTYSILLWTDDGMTESVAGMAYGVGVLVEVALMWWFKALTNNISARVCLFIAAACGFVRWSVLAIEPSVAWIFLAQALHGVSFGVTFLACTSFIARRVPDQAGARGQSLLATMSTACMAIATYSCGQLFDVWQSDLYWVMGAMCILATLLIGASYRFDFAE